MKFALMIPLAAVIVVSSSHAQDAIYRCPNNSYTNRAAEAKAQGCKLMEGGNITVVEGTRVSGAGSSGVRVASAAPTAPNQRVDAGDQKARDADSRQILEAELKKTEARQTELLKEYNNGEPEKLGPEHRNHQKYLDRVAEMKASIARNENDIAGIKREMSRVPASK